MQHYHSFCKEQNVMKETEVGVGDCMNQNGQVRDDWSRVNQEEGGSERDQITCLPGRAVMDGGSGCALPKST